MKTISKISRHGYVNYSEEWISSRNEVAMIMCSINVLVVVHFVMLSYVGDKTIINTFVCFAPWEIDFEINKAFMMTWRLRQVEDLLKHIWICFEYN